MIERARTLDPLSVPVTTHMGFELHYMGRDEEAIRQLAPAALDDHPSFPLAHFWLGGFTPCWVSMIRPSASSKPRTQALANGSP